MIMGILESTRAIAVRVVDVRQNTSLRRDREGSNSHLAAQKLND